MGKNDRHGIFINGLCTDVPKRILKQSLWQLMQEIDVNISRSRINVISQGRRTIAFVNIDNANTLDYVLFHLGSVESRKKVQFDFNTISKCLDNFYITRQKSKDMSAADDSSRIKELPKNVKDYSNNGLPVKQRSTCMVETGTSVSGLARLSLHNRPFDQALDASTSVSGLTPHFNGKCYRQYEKLGNETRNVEFKEGQGNYKHNILSEHIGKYVSAFMNSLEGGTLFVGVNDKGLVVGVICSHAGEDNLRLVIDQAIKQIEPSIFPPMYSVAFIPVLVKGSFSENLKVIEVSVHPKDNHTELYEFKGSVFVRMDGSVQNLKAKGIKAWHKKKAEAEFSNNQSIKLQIDDMTSKLQNIETQLKEQNRTAEKKSTVCGIL